MRQVAIVINLLFVFILTGQYLKAQQSPFGEDGIYISLQAGVNSDRMKTSGYLIDHLKFGNSTQPYLSALVDLDLEDCDVDALKGLIIRLELVYKPMHFYASGYANRTRYDNYEIKASTFAPVVSVLYRVPWRWKLRPYGGVGLGFRSSKVSKNTLSVQYDSNFGHDQVYENELNLERDNYAAVYTAGMMLGKRYDLNFRIWKSTWNRSDDVHRQLRNRSIMVAIGYRL